MTITEAAKTIKGSRQTIYNYIKQEKLHSEHNGDSYDIRASDLLDAFGMSSKTSKTSKASNETSTDDMSNWASKTASNETSSIDKYLDTLTEQLEKTDKQIQELHQNSRHDAKKC